MPLSRHYFFALLLFFMGCTQRGLHVIRESIDRENLASTFVKSPDPRQSHFQKRERFSITWNLPYPRHKGTLTLTILYRNGRSEEFSQSIDRRKGRATFSFSEEECEKKGGILTYRVAISTLEGEEIQTWKQRLWTNWIDSEEWLPCEEESASMRGN